MTLTERNEEIIEMVKNIINEKGYSGKLYLEPIRNTATSRPRYGEYKEGDTLRFTIHMWDVNKIDNINELMNNLNKRVDDAINHFKSKGLLL